MKTRLTTIAATLAALALPVLAQTTNPPPNAPADRTVAPGNAPADRTVAPGNAPADRTVAPGNAPADRTVAPGNAPADRTVAPGTAAMPTPTMPLDSRARAAGERDESDRLEKMLATGQNRADYRSMLEKEGWKISAINSDKPDYIEYEIVKGNKSYEVQLDFDNNSPKATKIDVAPNMWRAASTKAMLKDEKYVHSGPMAVDPEARFSDRRYMKDWTSEKESLEKALAGPNMKSGDYRAKLEQMGYRVTSVNDREKDYLEYEIVKGNNSYEVQIDLDPKTMVGKKVDVATNVWETDTTERAKGDKK